MSPGCEGREVDDDVVALGDALFVELLQLERADDEVAVVGDEVERHARARGEARCCVDRERQLDEARHRRIEDAEAIAARQHLHVGIVGAVDGRMSPRKPSVSKMSKNSWPSWSKRRIGDREVDVEVGVAPRQLRPARQLQVDAVGEILAAAIGTAVDVAQGEVALVHVLGREEEAVIVEPHRALQFAEVAWDLNQAVAVVGAGSLLQVVGVRLRATPAACRGAPAWCPSDSRRTCRGSGRRCRRRRSPRRCGRCGNGSRSRCGRSRRSPRGRRAGHCRCGR